MNEPKAQSVASDALLCDPFRSLPIETICEIRNEALNHMDGSDFAMHGFTFTMPGALFRANSRLMMERPTHNTRCLRTRHLVEGTQHPLVGRPN